MKKTGCLALLFAVSVAFAQEAAIPQAPADSGTVPTPASTDAAVPIPPAPPAPPALPGPEKLAVYVTGASDADIGKALGSKLLAAASQSGKYAQIHDEEAFHKELAENHETGLGHIVHAAKQHGADFVCLVSITEVLGIHSISARLVKTSDNQVAKSYSLDNHLKTPEDLDKASGELAAQLFPQEPPAAPVAEAAPEAPAKECANKLNINEITSKIQSGFPSQLKDCSITLAKNMALAMSPFGKKTEMKEPKAFMTECTVEGIKKKLPAGSDEYVKPVETFIQNLLNNAMAGASLDVKKLSGAIGSMNVNDLMNEIKTKAANDPCVVDEPYAPVAEDKKGDSEADKGRKILTFGFRGGINFSHLYSEYSNSYDSQRKTASGSYNSVMGWQLGLVWDIAPLEWLHIQPGLMYIQKGAEDDYGKMQVEKGIDPYNYYNYNDKSTALHSITLHSIEIPLMLYFKLFVFRLGAGPYFAVGVDFEEGPYSDVGMQYGLGVDLWKFYIGAFYDYGFSDISSEKYFKHYNRTIGFNLGVNL
jgi:hypothetical protein